MRVVLDTNVIISRFLSPTGIPAQLVNHWLNEQPFTLVVTEEILHEYANALLYPHIQKRHQLLHSHIERFIILIRRQSLLVSSSEAGVMVSADPDDNKFIDAAITGKAEYIVSGDTDLLSVAAYRGIRVLTPTRFLALLQEKQAA